MAARCITLLIGAVLIVGNILGCASTPANDRSVCDGLTAPASYQIFLFLSKEYNPPEQIVQALENNTTYALLQLNQDVKIVKDLKTVGNDGILLRIDIIGSRRGGVSKRIDIRYQIINNASKEVMVKENDAVNSKLGYEKITIKLGRKIANKVNGLISCMQGRGKQSTNVTEKPVN